MALVYCDVCLSVQKATREHLYGSNLVCDSCDKNLGEGLYRINLVDNFIHNLGVNGFVSTDDNSQQYLDIDLEVFKLYLLEFLGSL